LHILCDLNGGGAERLVFDLCRFAPSDVVPHVATLFAGGDLAPHFETAGISVRCAGRKHRRPSIAPLFRLAQWAREVDVVHTHLWAGDTWGRVAGLIANRPVLTTEHNTRGDTLWRQDIWLKMAPLSKSIACVSQAASEVAIDLGVPADKVCVVPNGIDLSRFHATQPRPGFGGRALAIGRLVPQKGFDLLIAAMKSCPPLTLDIVGDGPERERLLQLAKPLAGRVVIHGWTADVQAWFRNADMVIVPSRWEGFGLVAIEAMASGVPVIAAGVPGLSQVVADAGLQVKPLDMASLIAAMNRLASEPALRMQLSTFGRSRVQEFGIQKTVEAYRNLYGALTEARPSSRF